MSSKTISADEFATAVVKIMSDYADSTAEELSKISDDVSKEAVKKLKKESPKSKTKTSGTYAKGWSRKLDKTKSTNEWTVYNKNAGLTHLLEKGHAVKPAPKKPGKKTRVEGKEHIAPVEEWAQNEMVERAVNKL